MFSSFFFLSFSLFHPFFLQLSRKASGSVSVYNDIGIGGYTYIYHLYTYNRAKVYALMLVGHDVRARGYRNRQKRQQQQKKKKKKKALERSRTKGRDSIESGGAYSTGLFSPFAYIMYSQTYIRALGTLLPVSLYVWHPHGPSPSVCGALVLVRASTYYLLSLSLSLFPFFSNIRV